MQPRASRYQICLWTSLSALLLLALTSGAACGVAATPTQDPATTDVVPEPQVSQLPSASPTSLPRAQETTVAAGKVTIMVPGWGNERFQSTLGSGGTSNVYGFLLFGALINTNENAELLPGIASDWHLSDDGRTWTFTIRKGVRFHDGTEMTAEDVLWSFRHSWDPLAAEWSTNSGNQSFIPLVDKIEQAGPDKVSIALKGVDPAFATDKGFELGSSWLSLMPRRDTLHNEAQELAYDKNPIGQGPMKLLNHTSGDRMEFERFDEYFYQPKYGLPEDRRVNFRFLDLVLAPEEATRVAAIRAGAIDITSASLATKGQVEAGGGRMIFGREGAYFRVMLNGCYEPQFPCHDKRVRQALNYAVDKEIMRDRLFGPEVMEVKGWGVVTPSTIGYSPELDPFPFDPEKARQLLTDAGYPDGRGFGKLVMHTWVSSAMPLLPESAQLVADYWRRELGIDAEVKVGDETILKQALAGDELHGQILWRDNDTRLDAASNLLKAYGTPGVGYQFHDSQELFDFVGKGMVMTDLDSRAPALNKVYQRLRDESYELAIGYVNIPWAVGPRIETWAPYPLASHPTALHTITLK